MAINLATHENEISRSDELDVVASRLPGEITHSALMPLVRNESYRGAAKLEEIRVHHWAVRWKIFMMIGQLNALDKHQLAGVYTVEPVDSVPKNTSRVEVLRML